MNWFLFTIITISSMVIQGGNLLNFASFTEYVVKPDLLLILLVFICIYAEPSKAVISAFLIGFAADVITATMGPNIIAYVLIAAILTSFQNELHFKSLLLDSGLIFIISIIETIISISIFCIAAGGSFSHFFFRLFAGALYTAIAGPFIWLLLRSISKYLGLKIRK